MNAHPSNQPGFAAPLPLVWGALVLVYLIWGSTYLAIKLAIDTVPPYLMMGVRVIVAGAILYAWAIGRGETVADRPGRRQWLACTVVGGLLLCGGLGTVSWAEQHVPTGMAALLVATTPLWFAILDRIWNGTGLHWRAITGLVLGFGGTAALVSPQSGYGAPTWKALTILGATLSWAIGSLYAKRAPLPKRPMVATALELLGGGVVLLTVAALRGEFAAFDPAGFSAKSLGGVLYLIFFGSLVGYNCYSWLLRVAPISLVSTYAYVNPVVAVALGRLVLSEPISGGTLLSGAITLGGVALIVSAQSPGRHPASAKDRAPVPDTSIVESGQQ